MPRMARYRDRSPPPLGSTATGPFGCPFKRTGGVTFGKQQLLCPVRPRCCGLGPCRGWQALDGGEGTEVPVPLLREQSKRARRSAFFGYSEASRLLLLSAIRRVKITVDVQRAKSLTSLPNPGCSGCCSRPPPPPFQHATRPLCNHSVGPFPRRPQGERDQQTALCRRAAGCGQRGAPRAPERIDQLRRQAGVRAGELFRRHGGRFPPALALRASSFLLASSSVSAAPIHELAKGYYFEVS